MAPGEPFDLLLDALRDRPTWMADAACRAHLEVEFVPTPPRLAGPPRQPRRLPWPSAMAAWSGMSASPSPSTTGNSASEAGSPSGRAGRCVGVSPRPRSRCKSSRAAGTQAAQLSFPCPRRHAPAPGPVPRCCGCTALADVCLPSATPYAAQVRQIAPPEVLAGPLSRRRPKRLTIAVDFDLAYIAAEALLATVSTSLRSCPVTNSA